MSRSRIVGIIIVALVAFAAYYAYNIYQFYHHPLGKAAVIKVYPGFSAGRLAQELHQQHLLQHPHVFKLVAYLQGATRNLKSGEYQITPTMTAIELLHNITQGKVIIHDFTIIEGWTFAQVKNALLANAYLKHTVASMSEETLMKKLHSTYTNPEGLFFPDTYYFKWPEDDFSILQKAYALMQKKLNQEWETRAPQLLYKDPYQALIVASMIEKETSLAKERSMVAGVILRRLKKRMRLQIDPTVVYGLGEPFEYRLTREDLMTPTPYNTYLNYGLPPTPIDMPSLASIHAALHPDDSDYLYYVARGDGSHIFSTNYRDHQQAVLKYRIEMQNN